jgi:hypothetical protein
MTTGEYLVSNSTLSSGTAMQHLLALQIGTGTGSGEAIFTSKIFTTYAQPRITYTQRIVKDPVQNVARTTQKQGKPTRADKYAYVLTAPKEGYVLTGTDLVTIVQVKR